MTETTEGQPFNPKPDTAEGVGELLASTRAFVEEHVRPRVEELTAPDGTKGLFLITSNEATPFPEDEFDNFRDQPRFRQGTATLLDLNSFIMHAQRFLDSNSMVFADNDRDHPSLTAVLDYHPSGATSAPRWGRHRGFFEFPLSDEWRAWHEFDGKQMDMVNFARFLEDHIVDVLPSGFRHLNDEQQRYVDALGGDQRIAEPARLMEIATGLQLVEQNATVNAVNLGSGEVNMQFVSQHQDREGGALMMPSMFVIGIPVVVNGPAYHVLARFRYRSNGQGKVTFAYELWRTDRVFDHAFTEAIEKVAAETGLPVLLGKPE